MITYWIQLQHLRAKSSSEPDTNFIAKNYIRDATTHIISITSKLYILRISLFDINY